MPGLPWRDRAAQWVAVTRGGHGEGPYLGFDTSIYPGDDNMRTWLEHAGYHWVGFYLPAPCHKDASWQGKRSTLESMGWGLAVLYVGQQTWGRTRSGGNHHLLDESRERRRGRVDADDAIARTAVEGFPPGTAIFLDIERMEQVPNAMRDYYVAFRRRPRPSLRTKRRKELVAVSWSCVLQMNGRGRPSTPRGQSRTSTPHFRYG